MTLAPGQSREGTDARNERRVAAEAIEAGDAVALNDAGEVVLADDTNDPNVYGVAGYKSVSDAETEGYAAGEQMNVIYRGSVVANVAAGIAPGAVLGASATEGELAVGSNYKHLTAQYGEGANPGGEGGVSNVPDGFAHVEL